MGLLFLAVQVPVSAQRLTLSEAIETARTRSVAALQAKHAFVSTYWAWRSYQASRLPSLRLYGNLLNFDRSLALLQDPGTGEMVYANSYNLQNSLGLALSQNLTFSGGTLSVYSDLSRIDQFGTNRKLTWYAQPITVSYRQPLFSYNRFKWDKLISPKEYEVGKRTYIENMEQINIRTVSAYFNLLLAQMNQEVAQTNYMNTGTMRSVAAERMKLGSVTRDEYLQLELRMLNDSISINESSIRVREARMILNSLLGYDESFEADPVLEERLPDVLMDYDMVMRKALDNSTFDLLNDIKLLNAESAVARAKADRGISMSFNARFGLSNTAPELPAVYQNPLNQEVLGLSFNVPIFDWGLGRGRVQRAKAAEEVARAQVQQSENDYRRQIFTAVGQFNSQRQQCHSSRRAKEVAEERYTLMMEKFRRGNASVLELNSAQSEKDAAVRRYISDLSNYWNYYYGLRRIALYDFIGGKDLDVPFGEMINQP